MITALRIYAYAYSISLQYLSSSISNSAIILILLMFSIYYSSIVEMANNCINSMRRESVMELY